MADPIVFAGNVEWSGENPGISLKEAPDGPFVALASFFRVVLSPHGRGHALVLLQSPQDGAPPPDRVARPDFQTAVGQCLVALTQRRRPVREARFPGESELA